MVEGWNKLEHDGQMMRKRWGGQKGNTIDNSLEVDLILATKELPKHLDTTSDTEIEVDVTSNNEVAERKVVEEERA